MKILWDYKLNLSMTLTAYFAGYTIKFENKNYFIFRKNRLVTGISFDDKGITGEKILIPDVEVGLPHTWMVSYPYLVYRIVEDTGAEKRALEENQRNKSGLNYIVLSYSDTVQEKDYCVNLETKEKHLDIPCKIENEYLDRMVNRKTHIDDEYCFDDYIVSQIGTWGYQCKRNSELLWKFQGRGYLYTELFRYGDHIFFGTDGMGGHFYILELKTGKVVCDINTKGTNHFVIDYDKVYILSREKKSFVKCISLSTGKVIDEIQISGTVYSDCRILRSDDNLFVTTFEYTTSGSLKAVIFHLIAMNRLGVKS